MSKTDFHSSRLVGNGIWKCKKDTRKCKTFFTMHEVAHMSQSLKINALNPLFPAQFRIDQTFSGMIALSVIRTGLFPIGKPRFQAPAA